jgi:hypothetical protein
MGHFENFVPTRIYSALNTGIIILLMCAVPFFSLGFLFLKNLNPKYLEILKLVVVLIFGAELVFGNNNIALIRKEYNSGIITNYDDAMKERYKKIEKLKSKNDCWKMIEFESLEHPPKTIYYDPDIRSNRYDGHWNQAYENYFELHEVRLISDTIDKKLQLKQFLNPLPL